MKRSILFILGLFLVLPMVGQYWGRANGTSWVNTDYNTTEGTDFWVTFMRNSGSDESDEKDMTLYLYATSREDARVRISNPRMWGEELSINLKANQQDSILIPNSWAYIQIPQTASNLGIHVESNKPISLYSTSHHSSGKYDASLVLPTTALESEYVLQTYLQDVYATEFAIVATRNQYIYLTVLETKNNVTDSTEISVYLRQGQSYLYRSSAAKASLSGTKICSDYPFAVFQGGQCAKITKDPENHIFHQATPTDQLGKTFVVVPTINTKWEIVRFTSTKPNTKIYKNGSLFATLQRVSQTCQDTLRSTVTLNSDRTFTFKPATAIYTSSAPIACYQYGTGYTNNMPNCNDDDLDPSEFALGAPTMSSVIPQEYGLNSCLFATLSEGGKNMKHYVNIAVPTSEVSSMRLDNTNIASYFTPLSSSNYSYAIIPISNQTHLLRSENKGINSVFTARVYGLVIGDEDSRQAYAYAAGSRVDRSADMLMQDKYTDSIEMCGNDPLDLKALIRYDYTDVQWQLIDSMNWGVISNPRIVGEDPKHVVVDSFPPIYEGEYVDWTVNLFVTRTTPLCEHLIRDTITGNARVYRTHFNDSVFAEGKSAKEICYGKYFTVEYVDKGATKPTKHTFKADSTIEQTVNHGPYGKVRFKVDSLYFFNDSLHTSYLGCDSIIQQRIVIRPTYKDIQYDTICVNQFPYTWKLNGDFDYMETKVDTTEAWKRQYKLTNPNSPYKVGVIDTFVNLKTVCNCDSIIHLNLTVLPIYQLAVNYGEECGSSDTLMWPGHLGSDGMPLPGHKIYCNGTLMDHPISKDVNVRTTFKLVDSLKISRCTSCYGDQICDSIWTLTQTIKKVTNINQNVCICDVESFVWLDTLWLGSKCDYPTSTAYKAVRRIQRADTTLSVRYKTQGDGCDSVYKATVHFNPSYIDHPVDTTVFHICEQDTFIFRHDPYQTVHQWEVEDGHVDRYEFRDTVPTSVKCGHGCDSIVLHYVYVHPSYTLASKTDTVCLNTEYLWEGHTPTEGTDRYYWIDELNQRVRFDSVPTDSAGVFHLTDSLKTTTCQTCHDSLGCDSVWTKTVIVGQVYNQPTDTFTLCSNDTLWWQGIRYAGSEMTSSIYQDTVRKRTVLGCDSVLSVYINVLPAYPVAQSITRHTICDNDTLHFFDQIIYGKKFADIPLDTPDSLVLSAQATAYDKFFLDTTIMGCDSLVHHQIVVCASFDTLIYDTVPQYTPYTWIGHEHIAISVDQAIEMVYTDSLHSSDCPDCARGYCDSIWKLQLFVAPTSDYTVSKTICEGESYTWAGGGDTTVMGRPVPRTDTLQLGAVRYVSEDYTKAYKSQYGADSIHRLHLTVLPKVYERVDQHHSTSDAPIEWNGRTLVFDHIYKDTICDTFPSLQYGCDSIVELYLVVDSSYVYKEDAEICQHAPFTWTGHNVDISTDSAGVFVYIDSLLSTNLTDSIHQLNLVVHPIYDTVEYDTICSNESLDWQHRTISGLTEGEYTYDTTYATIHGCDSTYHLKLKVWPVFENNDQATICDNQTYDYNGHLFSHLSAQTEPYKFDTLLHTIHGCDSLVHLALYVKPTYYIVEDSVTCQVAGGIFTWDKHTNRMQNPVEPISLTEATQLIIVDSLKTQDCPNCEYGIGCDSVHVLHLLIRPVYDQHEYKTMSEEDTCIWEGIRYGGVKTTLPHDITVSKDTMIDTLFLTHEVNGVQCDSMRHLHIRIGQVTRITTEGVSCMNEPYTWYGQDHTGQDSIRQIIPASEFTGKTVYETTDKFLTTLGFDSIYYLHLDILPYYPVTAERTYYDSVCQGYYKPWVGHDRQLYSVDQQQWINNTEDFVRSLPVGTYTFHDSIGTLAEHTCDSVWALILRVDSIYDSTQYDTICQNETYQWQGRSISGIKPGQHSFDKIYPTIHGCDSAFHLKLYVWPVFDTIDSVSICQNERYDYHGHIFTDLMPQADPYVLDTTLQSVHGCDSAVHFSLYVYPTYTLTTDTFTCQTDYFVWEHHEGHTIWDNRQQKRISANEIPADLAEGIYTYIDSLKTTTCTNCENGVGCDSVHILNLRIDSVYHRVDNITMSDEETRKWEHIIYIGTHVNADTLSSQWFEPELSQGLPKPYVVRIPQNQVTNYDDTTYQTIHGCDSTRHLVLLVGPTFRDTIVRYTCDNEPYQWYHEGDPNEVKPHVTKLEPKFYYDSLRTRQFGFDSIYVLDLRNNPTYHQAWSDTACQGTHYEWTRASVSAQVYWVDSSKWVNKAELSTSIAGSYTYVDSLLTTDFELGEGQATRPGCDSTWTLHLLVPPSYYFYDTLSLCQNDTLHWQDSVIAGDRYDGSYALPKRAVLAPGVYDFSINYGTTISGAPHYSCDSIYNLHLAVHSIYDTTRTYHTCWNETYVWQQTDMEGTHEDLVWEARQIDTTWISALAALQPQATKDTLMRHADRMLKTIHGCDSMSHMNLVVQPSYFFYTDTIICSTEKVVYRNKTFRQKDTTYTERLKTAAGCDSIYQLHLHVKPSYFFHRYMATCDNEVLYHESPNGREILWDTTHSLIDTLTDAWFYTSEDCDSVYRYHITIHPTYHVDEPVTICENEQNWTYTWHQTDAFGMPYQHTFTFDTIQAEDLEGAIKQDVHIRFTDTLPTIHGCDSITTLQLTVHPIYAFHQDTIICQDTISTSAVWFDQFGNAHPSVPLAIGQAGEYTYTDSLRTIYGCDSIFTISVHVAPIYRFDSTYVICDHERISWQDKWYTGRSDVAQPGDSLVSTGLLTDTVKYPTNEGCDSTFILHLKVYSSYFFSDTVALCSDQTYPMHNHLQVGQDTIYDQLISGYIPAIDTLYKDSLKSGHGCDSVFWLQVHHAPRYLHVDYDTICDNESTSWRSYTYNQMPVGDTVFRDAYTTTADGCDSVFELRLCVHPTYTFYETDTICADEQFNWQTRTLEHLPVGWNDFDTTYQTIYRCDSTYYLHLLVKDTTNEFISDTICVGETYNLHGQLLTQTGRYKDTIPNAWGCHHFTYLNLYVTPPTTYTLSLGQVCADDPDITVGYDYSGLPLLEYSVYFDSVGHHQGFQDIIHRPIQDIDHHLFWIPLPSGDPLPQPTPAYFDSRVGVNRFTNETKYAYPQPNDYPIRVVMHNGFCHDSLQSKQITFNVRYPSWIHEQHWNDALILYSPAYNGGYEFSAQQWYHNGQPIIGQTSEYLYLPQGLELNPDTLTESSKCLSEYSILLTRKSDGKSFFTCPICPVQLADTIVPRLDYYSVVPTFVSHEHPVVGILSTVAGEYNVTGAAGAHILSGSFTPDDNKFAGSITLPSVPGLYSVTLTSPNLEQRTCKVLVE